MSSIEEEIRDSGYSGRDYSRAWIGFWFVTWVGIALSGSVAGCIVAALGWLVAIDPASSTGNVLDVFRLPLAGLLLAAVVGFFVVTLTALCSWLFRSYHDPCGLAAIAGGITAFLCMPLFSIITLPVGIAGGWCAARQFMKTQTARPMFLFSQLREERWREEQAHGSRD